jgi:hypothetical protein
MPRYEPPKVIELGSLDDLTESRVYKSFGWGDVIHVGCIDVPVPAHVVGGS